MKRHFKGFVAKVEVLKSERATEDKNGLMPVILLGIAGEIPSRTVISGTIARRMNIQEGSKYHYHLQQSKLLWFLVCLVKFVYRSFYTSDSSISFGISTFISFKTVGAILFKPPDFTSFTSGAITKQNTSPTV